MYYSSSQKYAAEAFGTFILVFFGCGTAMLTGASIVATSLAFGLSIIAAAYTIGGISGAHLNPAVSFGLFFEGRMSLSEAIKYSISQVIGSIAASAVLAVLVLCGALGEVYDDGEYVTGTISDTAFGANGFGTLNFFGALVTEVVLTCIFVLVVLCVTDSEDEGVKKHAGIFIGVTLAFVHLLGINLTGTSVNPARSIGPAIFAIAKTSFSSITQLWVFIVGPIVGAFLAALIKSMLIKKKN